VSSHRRARYGIINGLQWAVAFACFWAFLSQNQGWGFGVCFILLATWCAHKTRLRIPVLAWQHLPGFLWFFLRRLLVGGVDVALRTLASTPAVNPGWTEYQLKTRSADVSLSLSAIVGLLPGTLAARSEDKVLRVHLLDVDRDWQTDIAKLESHLALLLPASSIRDHEEYS
jgi:multicomponent Na+:H+ antiporter subunit E